MSDPSNAPQTPPSCCATAPDPTAQREGKWGPVFFLPNVAIHVHLLPNGKVLFWGRRDRPDGSMDEHECTPHLWDPQNGTFSETPQPALDDRDHTKVNLFCSGHAFLPDGRLLVAGGHLQDGHGDIQASTYDYRTDEWTALPLMNNGRWYPNAITLADGSILVTSGSYFDGIRKTPQNRVPQIFDGASWHAMAPPEVKKDDPDLLSLYPRTHLLPDGRVVFTGMNAQSLYFDARGGGTWTPAPSRALNVRDYCPSVMYDVGKVIYIGGGNEPGNGPPTNQVEIIDYNDKAPQWRMTAPMHFRRRQHNGVILPDGTVLVTGGTQGPGFNDITPGQPIHAAELWDPRTGSWTLLAEESVDRCYHCTAILLPDGSVLSAGSGEGGSDPNVAHREAQIFFPPYLFRGDRPTIGGVPEHLDHGQDFVIDIHDGDVARISLVRLASVTHAFDQNQRINFLDIKVEEGKVTATAPARAEICPPGHYMLFALNAAGVPSQAQFIHVGAWAPPPRKTGAAVVAALAAQQNRVKKATPGTRVTVGLTSTCPYGLGACWGGAYEALKKLSGVTAVETIPSAENSTAGVYISQELPALDRWPQELAASANGSYTFRGVEMTLQGTARVVNDTVELTTASGQIVQLVPLTGMLLQLDKATGRPRRPSKHEIDAVDRLKREIAVRGGTLNRVHGFGQIERQGAAWTQRLRSFSVH